MPKLLEKTHNVSRIYREANIAPKTLNEEDRTVEVRFISDDNGGERYGFYGEGWDDFGEFVEELSIERKHMRTERLESGNAPFLKDHNSSTIDNVLGAIESIRFASDGVYATVRFDTEGEGDKQWKRVQNGTLRNVSVGYSVHRMEEVDRVKRGDTTIPLMRVTDFEPFEVSLVAIGFDGLANVRNADDKTGVTNPCTFLIRDMEKRQMPKPNEPEHKDRAGDTPEPVVTPGITAEDAKRQADQAAKEAVKAERARSKAIIDQCASVGLERDFADTLIDDEKVTVEVANERILAEFARKHKDAQPESPSGVTSVTPQQPDLGRSIEAAMQFRINPRAKDARSNLVDAGGDFWNGMTLVDIGREMLRTHGIDTQGMNRNKLCERIMSFRSGAGSMHGDSDFPSILENVMNKFLRDPYTEIPSTWGHLTTLRTVNDFKEITNVQLGEGETPSIVKPGGEYEQATVSEGAEKYGMDKRGIIYAFTWEMLINDDLNAFRRIGNLISNGQRRGEDDFFWNLITSNPNMDVDGLPVFDGAHGNLAAGGDLGAPSVATLSAARSAMRKQLGLDGALMNIIPMTINIPTTLETATQQLLGAITPNKVGEFNPFVGSLNIVVEPRLDADSTTAWYLSADTNQIDIIEEARLAGEIGPTFEQKEGFEVDSIKFKSRNIYGGKVLDYRGLYKNPGA